MDSGLMKLRGDALTHTCGTETKVLNDSLTFDFHLRAVTLEIITMII